MNVNPWLDQCLPTGTATTANCVTFKTAQTGSPLTLTSAPTTRPEPHSNQEWLDRRINEILVKL